MPRMTYMEFEKKVGEVHKQVLIPGYQTIHLEYRFPVKNFPFKTELAVFLDEVPTITFNGQKVDKGTYLGHIFTAKHYSDLVQFFDEIQTMVENHNILMKEILNNLVGPQIAKIVRSHMGMNGEANNYYEQAVHNAAVEMYGDILNIKPFHAIHTFNASISFGEKIIDFYYTPEQIQLFLDSFEAKFERKFLKTEVTVDGTPAAKLRAIAAGKAISEKVTELVRRVKSMKLEEI